jgi:hypothetical protein
MESLDIGFEYSFLGRTYLVYDQPIPDNSDVGFMDQSSPFDIACSVALYEMDFRWLAQACVGYQADKHDLPDGEYPLEVRMFLHDDIFEPLHVVERQVFKVRKRSVIKDSRFYIDSDSEVIIYRSPIPDEFIDGFEAAKKRDKKILASLACSPNND